MIDLEKRIRAVGVPGKSSGSSKKPVYEVFCQVCGGVIRSDDIPQVEYVQARSGTDMFFHCRCLKRGKTDG